ncbi:MAG: nucleotidyltransferase family protein [Verrucomicrobiota bacterium]
MNLTTNEINLVKNILSTHVPEFEVRAFGSRVHGKHLRPFSDLDLAMMTDKPLGLDRYAQLKAAFSDSDLPFKVDVVDWASIDESFQKIIGEDFEIIQPAC